MHWLLLLFFLLSSLQAKIIEMPRIEALLHYVNDASCVIFNFDNTLIEGENQLGRIEWHHREIEKRQRAQRSFKEAKEAFYPEWILSQMICPFRSPEKETAFFIAKTQEIAPFCSVLTERLPSIAALSVEQLLKLKMDFSKSAPKNLEAPPGDLYRNGIYFLGAASSKTKAVESIFRASQTPLKRLIVIDANREALEALEKDFASDSSFSFIGLHYTKTQERPFCEEIANLQYRALPDLISDSYATRLLEEEMQLSAPLTTSSQPSPIPEG